jgi:hypothetical protein
MKRRESGKSARHARQDGWRAPSQAMLKYCRHKTTPTPAPPGARRALRPDDSSQSRRSRAAAEFRFQVQSGRLCREEQSGRSSRRWTKAAGGTTALPHQRERKIGRDGTLDHDSRTVQQTGWEYCIPVFLKTFGSDVASATGLCRGE